jgi:hypothetical protein
MGFKEYLREKRNSKFESEQQKELKQKLRILLKNCREVE